MLSLMYSFFLVFMTGHLKKQIKLEINDTTWKEEESGWHQESYMFPFVKFICCVESAMTTKK